jgi:hypothetical protein
MSDSKSLQRYIDQLNAEQQQSLATRAVEQALALTYQTKAAVKSASIQIKDIKPRQTQALLDEVKARWQEGSLF